MKKQVKIGNFEQLSITPPNTLELEIIYNKGIPKQDIVLAFQSINRRKLIPKFAVA